MDFYSIKLCWALVIALARFVTPVTEVPSEDCGGSGQATAGVLLGQALC